MLRYCPECGAPLGVTPPTVCDACGTRHWRNAKPCAGGLVVRGGRLLLIRRAIDPWRGCWDIPGGFCDADEHPADTVAREVREETGLTVVVGDLLGIWMDTYGEGTPQAPPETTLNCYFHAVAVGPDEPIVDPAEASEARWFSPDALPTDLSFPAHTTQVLAAWVSALGGAGSG